MAELAKVPARNFKELIAAVLKFPPSASISASEIVHFAVNKGRARASVAGVVVSTASVVAMRDVGAFTADYRPLSAYAAILPDDSSVDIDISTKSNQVRFVCGEHKLTLALTLGCVVPRPKVADPFVTIDDAAAAKLKWLASVAEKDEAKIDMCCVYLKDGRAMAGNQKSIGVARIAALPKNAEGPLPLNLCAVVGLGDRLTQVEGGLILSSGCGVSQVPNLVQSLKFPISVVNRLEKAAETGTVFGVCDARAMAAVFRECGDCVARIPKAEASMVMSFKDGKIWIKAQSQTATFRTVLEGKVKTEGEIWLGVNEAESALSAFGEGEVSCMKLAPKGEAALVTDGAKVFFAPVKHPV